MCVSIYNYNHSLQSTSAFRCIEAFSGADLLPKAD